jgi:hypothetical protein
VSALQRVLASAAVRRLPRLVAGGSAVLALAGRASACPYCSLSQSADTLLYIAGFLLVPYLVVSAVLFWIRRILRAEQD